MEPTTTDCQKMNLNRIKSTSSTHYASYDNRTEWYA